MRLDKYLSFLGVCSRKQAGACIRSKKVKVNDRIITKPEFHVKEESDKIEIDGRLLSYSRYSYYMLNKPAGVVSAVTDAHDRTVLDLMDIAPKRGMFPVGRLDKDTEGLLLITNDGKLAHNLLSPAKHIDKKYYVELNKSLSEDAVGWFLEGLDIGEKSKTKPAKLEIIHSGSQAYLTITEGKFHQVKRMFAAIGLEVTYLKRVSMGPLALDENLKTGEYRKLTAREIALLRECKGSK